MLVPVKAIKLTVLEANSLNLPGSLV